MGLASETSHTCKASFAWVSGAEIDVDADQHRDLNRKPQPRLVTQRRIRNFFPYRNKTRNDGGLRGSTTPRARLHGTSAIDLPRLEDGAQLPSSCAGLRGCVA